MARPLLESWRMDVAPGRWIRLNPDNVAALPDEAGIFEIANLVRNVILIGRAEGSLRRRLAALIQPGNALPASTGGYYVRVATTAAEEAVLAERLEAFRARHAGRVPLGNDGGRTPLRVAQREAA